MARAAPFPTALSKEAGGASSTTALAVARTHNADSRENAPAPTEMFQTQRIRRATEAKIGKNSFHIPDMAQK